MANPAFVFNPVCPILSGGTFTGRYFLASAQQTVVQTAHNGTTTGFLWFQNPVGSTQVGMIRRMSVSFNSGSALATPTAPVISFSKFTFTGTASGATVANLPASTALGASTVTCRSAVTGMTVTLVNPLATASIPSAETAVGAFAGFYEAVPYDPMAFNRGLALELAAGEGLAVWQSVGGTASDTRAFTLNAVWDELSTLS